MHSSSAWFSPSVVGSVRASGPFGVKIVRLQVVQVLCVSQLCAGWDTVIFPRICIFLSFLFKNLCLSF